MQISAAHAFHSQTQTHALPQAAPAPGKRVFEKPAALPTALLLAIAWAIPFVLHMGPWGNGAVPLGAFLLPMFWAAFIAVYLYGLGIGLVVGLFSPFLNLITTGMPAAAELRMMMLELAVFVVLSWLVLRKPRGRKFWLLAPLAFIAAHICSTGVVLVTGTSFFGNANAPAAALFTNAITTGAPGLLILAAINYALVRGWLGNKNGGGGGHGPEQAA